MNDRLASCDPVGIVEIVERLGTSRGTVDTWNRAGKLPERHWTVGGRPAWDWPTLLEELNRTGVLHDGKVRSVGYQRD